jgi:hypothetical protein
LTHSFKPLAALAPTVAVVFDIINASFVKIYQLMGLKFISLD